MHTLFQACQYPCRLRIKQHKQLKLCLSVRKPLIKKYWGNLWLGKLWRRRGSLQKLSLSLSIHQTATIHWISFWPISTNTYFEYSTSFFFCVTISNKSFDRALSVLNIKNCGFQFCCTIEEIVKCLLKAEPVKMFLVINKDQYNSKKIHCVVIGDNLIYVRGWTVLYNELWLCCMQWWEERTNTE